jgi:hypothetical protein
VAVIVEGFTFLGSSDAYQQSSQETPLSSKRTLDDLWDRTDVDPLKPDEAPFAF